MQSPKNVPLLNTQSVKSRISKRSSKFIAPTILPLEAPPPFKYVFGLTAIVSDRTANAWFIDGLAAFHVQRALLHDASRSVPDAVAQLAWFPRVGRYLRGQHKGTYVINQRYSLTKKMWIIRRLSSGMVRATVVFVEKKCLVFKHFGKNWKLRIFDLFYCACLYWKWLKYFICNT